MTVKRTIITPFAVAHAPWVPKFSYRTFCDLAREEFAEVERVFVGELSQAESNARWRDRIAYATGCRRRIQQCGTWEPS